LILVLCSVSVSLLQVAAKAPKSEDSSWILGNVLEYDPKAQVYVVQDEDDVSRVMTVPYADVRRLEDSITNLRRGDRILAVFPETTSFYPAVVAKNPKPSGNVQQAGAAWDVIVKFDDDEDVSGKNPARRVPARFVLRLEDQNESDDDE
jgi:SAGA-associated factor 29